MHEAPQKLPMLSWWQFKEDESNAKICVGKYQYIKKKKAEKEMSEIILA